MKDSAGILRQISMAKKDVRTFLPSIIKMASYRPAYPWMDLANTMV
jgi:hypothetical protein